MEVRMTAVLHKPSRRTEDLADDSGKQTET
jgi:hypothetical protein